MHTLSVQVLGAVGGAATGATVGALGGPVGAVVGGAVGAVVGGLAGKGAAEAVNPTEEETYGRTNSLKYRPTYTQTRNHYPDLDYERDVNIKMPTALVMKTAHTMVAHTCFEDVESRSKKGNGDIIKGSSRLTWEQAKFAVKDAWDRADTLIGNMIHIEAPIL